MRSLFAIALAYTVVAGPCAAQSGQDADDTMMRMEAAMGQAQAQAARPGDETLDCPALEAEMVATMQDPAMQAQVASQGAWAQGQLDAAGDGRARMMAMMGGSMIIGIASSLIPGLGYAQMAQQRAMGAGMEAQSQQNMAEMMRQAEGVMTILPQLMRGQRVHELAQARQCAFLEQTQQ